MSSTRLQGEIPRNAIYADDPWISGVSEVRGMNERKYCVLHGCLFGRSEQCLNAGETIVLEAYGSDYYFNFRTEGQKGSERGGIIEVDQLRRMVKGGYIQEIRKKLPTRAEARAKEEAKRASSKKRFDEKK